MVDTIPRCIVVLIASFYYRRSLELKPGQTEEFNPPGDLRITNVALGDELADENGRTSVKLTYMAPDTSEEEHDNEDEDDDEEEVGEPVTTVLCSLTPGKVSHSRRDDANLCSHCLADRADDD